MDSTPGSGPPPNPPEIGKEFIHRQIAHYVVLEALGQGGMGIVFKAKDTRLDRLVALKVLQPQTVADPLRKQRFMQEARSASALNHPSIVHIYDIGEEGGVDYIAMEYIQGVTLSRLMRQKRLPWRDVVRYAVQAADALHTAHCAGILHRDLKPGNIMITERGLVKVLDFGLAKLVEPVEQSNPELEVTRTEYGPQTAQGIAVGTPGYMSPEQASGAKLDARSDIFSFGVVLYQMATGEQPFRGDSAPMILASILRDEPKPPGLVCPGLPLELERIILRCLRKEPARRFQTMLDLGLALEDLKEESATSVSRTTMMPAAVVVRRKRWLLALAGVLVSLGLAGGWWLLRKSPPPAPEAEAVRLTSDPGLSTDPAISADGKLLAYASDRSGDGNLDIWVQQIGGGEAIRLTHDPADDDQPDFSPDGTQIAFRSERDRGGIYLTSTLGGEELKIAEGGRRPRFSPDGKWITYWVGLEDRLGTRRPGGAQIYVMDSRGGSPRQLLPEFAAAAWPTWSPDGQYLLFLGKRDAGSGSPIGWWVTPREASGATQVQVPSAYETAVLDWAPYAWRGDRVIFTDDRNGTRNILEVTLEPNPWRLAGAPHRLTLGITQEDSPSLAADGRLVFASLNVNHDVYGLPVNTAAGRVSGSLRKLTREVADNIAPSISMDGTKLAFGSVRSGSDQIWTKDVASGKEALLARQPGTVTPFIRADGSMVAWDDHKTIFVEPFRGGAVQRVCEDCGYVCGWSRDGSKLLFTDYSAHSFVGVLDTASRQKTLLRHPKLSVFPRAFSPDGRWIACSAENPVRVMIVPFRPGRPPEESDWIAVTDGSSIDRFPQWSADGKLLYFSSDRDGLMCLWAQRLDPVSKRPVGEPFPVFHLHGASLRMQANMGHLSAARDLLVFSLEERAGNIWMLQKGH